jgi:hypothetical protein
MSTFSTDYDSLESAASDLERKGFKFDGDFWSKPSTVDDACGGYAKIALVTIIDCGGWYQIRFH